MKRTGMFLCACMSARALVSAAAQAPDEGVVEGAGLFAHASPSVMLLTVYDTNGNPLRQGSAFVVDGAGTLATSHDVVADAGIVDVRSADGRAHVASALLADAPDDDLALLHIEDNEVPALPLAEGEPAAADTAVHVVGSAVQLHNALFSGVVIRSPATTPGTRLEISNQFYPVTSGAPLLANDGHVLGVALYAADRARNVNLAVPVSALRALIAKAHDAPPARLLGTLSDESRSRMEGAAILRSKVVSECTPSDIVNIDRVIHDTLAVAQPLHDAGNAVAAFRLYEGASYKLLYLLADRCPSVSASLNEAIAATAHDDAVAQKASVLRYAFDAILGIPAEGERAPEL